MEQMDSLQRANQQHRLVEWSRRVEACRNSGLSVGQWCRDPDGPVSAGVVSVLRKTAGPD